MTDLKQIKFHASPEFADALKELAKKVTNGNQSEFITKAIAHYAQMLGTEMPVASAPHGVRSDALPVGWKSRMYPDRYQVVAVWNGYGFTFTHYHLYREKIENPITLLVDIASKKVELYVIGVTTIEAGGLIHKDYDARIYKELLFELMEWDA